ncbi:hypothetical protein BDZ89DRAFT_1167478 [Hymenopellis radicata]|nr:hypothetical protein BDZ89DRAFT_1167478 [Hymenopellis radicata]
MSRDHTSQKIAVEKSWEIEFKGESANFFLKILQEYQSRDHHGSSFYARYVTFIQSSGTGKSRIVDEAGRKCIHIPLNLSNAQPYPPSDPSTRYWLLLLDDYGKPYLRSQALLYGLLQQTRICLQQLEESLPSKLQVHDKESTRTRLQVLATMLRDHLTEGMTFEKHGENRRAFHAAARDLAEQFFTGKARLPEQTYSVPSAANALWEFIDPNHQLPASEPTVLLSFDSAHNILIRAPSLFPELCRALYLIKSAPFWAIFLSTAAKFPRVAPDPHYRLFLPITETGFDQFAERIVSGDPQWTLDRIASTHHIAHLGRALFATRFDQGDLTVREETVWFAGVKLLCFSAGSEYSILPDDAQLACLAVRLALDFKAGALDGAQRRQVEAHMRVVLSMDDNHNMITVSSSEPLLAQAAYSAMREIRSWVPAEALRKHIFSSGISVGHRGECAASLAVLLARDAAVEHDRASAKGGTTLKDDGSRRVIAVTSFLAALLATDSERLVAEPPTFYRSIGEAYAPLGHAFEDGHIWFNHFVRVDDFDVINQEFLWRLVGRGAAVICPNNQRSIDLLIPVLIGDVLAKENVTAIFIQIKNDKSYTEKPTRWLFDAMDPFCVGLFAKGVVPLPVIRMVFALASKEHSVDYLLPEKSPTLIESSEFRPPGLETTYTAYDIWCSGMSHRTFRVIRENEESTYQDILRVHHNPYMRCPSEFEKERGDMLRAMKPGVSSLPAHHRRYVSVDSRDVDVILDDEVPDVQQEQFSMEEWCRITGEADSESSTG